MKSNAAISSHMKNRKIQYYLKENSIAQNRKSLVISKTSAAYSLYLLNNNKMQKQFRLNNKKKKKKKIN